MADGINHNGLHGQKEERRGGQGARANDGPPPLPLDGSASAEPAPADERTGREEQPSPELGTTNGRDRPPQEDRNASRKRLSDNRIKHAVRARDGFRCTECGMTAEEHVALHGRNLEVHRIVPGSDYTPEGCVTLCRKCHGPKPRSLRNSVGFRLPYDLYKKAKFIAVMDEMPVRKYLDTILRATVERDHARVMRRIAEEHGKQQG